MNIRKTKYRHIFGKDGQNTETWHQVQLGSVYLEANPFAMNRNFFVLPWNKPRGSLLVWDSSKIEALPSDAPVLIDSETGGFNCFDISPFSDIVAGGTQNGKIYTYKVPQGGYQESVDQTAANQTLEGHTSRLLETSFHPSAENVLLSHCGGKQVKLWDLNSASEKLTLPNVHTGLICSTAFSYDGSQLVTFCKDKKLRIFDPRSNQTSAEVLSHDGAKGGKAIWMGKHDRILSVGFNKNQSRELFVYDPRNATTPLQKINIDKASTSTLIPLYDDDLDLIFLAGKGDGNIRYYEYADGKVEYLSEYKSSVALSGVARFPKQKLKLKDSEINRFLKLTSTQIIQVSFYLPRQFSGFDKEIFPDTNNLQPTFSSEEWFSGETKTPNLESLEQFAN
eukprot:TRINITY_DN15103_c0_g1_i1.p1 TRINITY_DN15103_c0_g1~~TRINITY_DN15103_c0_g1_i1.p1  ORF type:complete len:394 (-),score=130.69 TRINITY_DN15103_c0_g1_i1:26-1207(-)